MIKNRNLCFLLFLCLLVLVSCTFYSYKEGYTKKYYKSYADYLKDMDEQTIRYVNSTKTLNTTPNTTTQNKKRITKYKNKK